MPTSDRRSANPFNIVMGALMTICLGFSSFALKEIYAGNAQRQVLQVQLQALQAAVDEAGNKSEIDRLQDSQLSKHWKLHSWTRQMIDEARFDRGLGPSVPPDLRGIGE